MIAVSFALATSNAVAAERPVSRDWAAQDLAYMRGIARAFPPGSAAGAAVARLQQDSRRFGFVVAVPQHVCPRRADSCAASIISRFYAGEVGNCYRWAFLNLALNGAIVGWAYKIAVECGVPINEASVYPPRASGPWIPLVANPRTR